MSATTIVISALASNLIGTGHLRRMITLSRALQQIGTVRLCFHTTELGGRILADSGLLTAEDSILAASDDPAAGVAQLIDRLPELGADIVILDNYFWHADHENQLVRNCRLLVVVDDLTDRSHSADILLNPNPNANAAGYATRVPDRCTLLVGADYCLIGEAFRHLRSAGVPSPADRLRLRPIFLSLGGGDPNQDMLRLTELALATTDRPLSIATGSHIADAPALAALAARTPERIELVFDSPRVAEQMNGSAFAVAAGGTMTWERATLGLPSLSLIAADNQLEATLWLENLGYHTAFDLRPNWSDQAFAEALGAYDADEALRQQQAAASLTLIDGAGAARVASIILSR